jgi:hypothetical protein
MTRETPDAHLQMSISREMAGYSSELFKLQKIAEAVSCVARLYILESLAFVEPANFREKLKIPLTRKLGSSFFFRRSCRFLRPVTIGNSYSDSRLLYFRGSQGSVRARFDARALSYRSAIVRAKRCWSSRTISVNANLTRALLRNRHFNG